MSQTESWFYIDSQGRLIQRTENDGYAFLRHGACARERVVAGADIGSLSLFELQQALRAVLQRLQQGGQARD